MKASLKYEMLVDVSRPVEEIFEFINLMLQTHPAKRHEILQQVDEHIGIALAELQRDSSEETSK